MQKIAHKIALSALTLFCLASTKVFAADCADSLPAEPSAKDFIACLKEQEVALKKSSSNAISVPSLPLGAIIAWHRDFPPLTRADDPPLVLPDGWALCDGQPITVVGSPWIGRNTPNLNGVSGDVEYQKFLRGGPKSGVSQPATEVAVTLETDSGALYYYASGNVSGLNKNFDDYAALQQGSLRKGIPAPAGGDDPIGQKYAGTVRPTNMSVVWIMKVLN